MFASAGRALGMIFDPAFFGVLVKGLVLTILLFVGLFVGLRYALDALPALPWGWANSAIDVLEWVVSFGVGFVVLPIFVGAPVAAIFASFFLDEISAAVERKHYPNDPKPKGTPFLVGLGIGLRFALWVILANILLLPFNIFLPVVAWAVTLLVNGWLLGREFFELAAVRHLKVHDVDVLRRRHGGAITFRGIAIAALALVPFVSFFAPMFGVAFMADTYKRYEHAGLVRAPERGLPRDAEATHPDRT
jgi:CysZ protein